MDQNRTSKLFSWAGVLIVLLIILLVNFILGLGVFRTRIDMTEDKLYTLSQGTVNIVKDLDTKVNIRYYRTEDKDVVPEPVQVYIRRVEDILNEYKKRSEGKVEVELLNPEPDSDEEVAAAQDGINRNTLNLVESFYNGIVVQCLDKKVVLPSVDPQQEELLEYELSRAVAEVTSTGKPKIAIMTDEPIQGGPGAGGNPMNPMGGGGGTPPWFFPQLLERDYEVETIPVSTDKIEDDVDLLLVVHPKSISESSEYAIDQFVLRGGKLIAFIDPKFYFGQSQQPNPMMGGMSTNEPSTLKKLLPAWGITFSDTKVLADSAFKTQLQDGRGQRIEEPRVLSMNNEAFNEDVPATGSLQNMLMWEAGVFTGTPPEGLTKTTLIHSTEGSQLVTPSQQFGNDAEKIMSAFKPDGKEYDLAVMVSGTFKTAFPDGPPSKADDAEAEAEGEGDDEKAEDKADDVAQLKESASENTVALIGDVDMLHDQTFLRPSRNPFTGQTSQTMINTNMVLVQNMLEQMAGNENLIKIRSRTAAQRSFTKLREMDEESDKKFRQAAIDGQAEVDEAQRKLSEIVQSKGEKVNVNNLDPETQKALDSTREAFAEAKKKLRKINLDRRKDKEALLNRFKFANIVIMPLVVILVGVLLALFRNSKTAAK